MVATAKITSPADLVSAKARRYLREGRASEPAAAVIVTVRGDTGTYDVILYEDGRKACGCPALIQGCSHVQTALVKRWEDDQRKLAEVRSLA